MPWEYIYAQSDEGLCPGLVPHAYKMSKMIKMFELHGQVKLHRRVQLFKMFMKMIYDDNYDAKWYFLWRVYVMFCF